MMVDSGDSNTHYTREAVLVQSPRLVKHAPNRWQLLETVTELEDTAREWDRSRATDILGKVVLTPNL